jgi:hypothetical protein
MVLRTRRGPVFLSVSFTVSGTFWR